MTAIVAYTDGKTIYMAGDSFIGDDATKDSCKAPKVYQVGKNLLVGLCGQVRQELLLESFLKKTFPKKTSMVTEDWIKFEMPNLLFHYFKDNGAVVEREGAHTLGDSEYILGFDGKLFYLNDDFGVWETKENVASIGAGKQYCLGALHVLKEELSGNPEAVLIKSLEAAEKWCPLVTGPFILRKIG